MARRPVILAAALGVAALAAATPRVEARAQGPVAAPAPVASHQASPDPSHRALLDRYCVTCHNPRSKAGGLRLDEVDLAEVGGYAEVWEKVARKIRAGMMPPPGVRRPDAATLTGFATWLEGTLDAAAAEQPDPGRVGLHRLNRTEYAQAIQELLDLRVDAAALLPKDEEADGFDNVAAALRVSPSYLDQYVTAARLVSQRAIGSASPKPASAVYRPARGTDQSRRVAGLPPGTRGGLVAEHLFPADGEYRFSIGGLAGAFYMRGLEYQHTVLLTIDGEKVFEGTIGGEADLKAIDQQQAPAVAAVNARFQNIARKVTAGPHRVGVTFVARSYAESDELLYSYRPGQGEDRIARIGSLEVTGPFDPTGVSETPSRRRIFSCRPAAAAAPAEERQCATSIVTRLATAAYRRPVTDRDIAVPLAFYEQGRTGGDFEAGVEQALSAILASPRFLFRSEAAPANAAPGATYRLDDLEIATRLSFFLTGSAPDDRLRSLAAQDRLRAPAVLEAEVRRLLAAPSARATFSAFATQWLKLRGLDDIDPDGLQFPSFDPSLREAFKRELDLFVGAIVTEDRSVLDLLTGDFTFVNERLALHYGLPQVRGEAFQRVRLEDANRRGLLGKGAVLMATSYGNRTAPVIRGAWILENLIGVPPAPPPPDVEAFQENKPGEKARTIRAILEQHRANPACGACHRVMDPLGLALENYDAIGAWRSIDRFAGAPIDAEGELVDGTRINGPRELTAALARQPDQFVRTFTEKLMTFALGRLVEAPDMPTVRRIVRDAAPGGYQLSSIVLGIVRSAPFQMRRLPAADETENRPAR
jgi:hypothetical protein